MDPGARGRQWAQMGGWVAFTQAAQPPRQGNRDGCRDAAFGAPLLRSCMLALKYMHPYLRAHQI